MLKLFVASLAVLSVASAALVGGWNQGSQSDVEHLTVWCTKQLSQYAGLEGFYTIRTAKNVRFQVVNGINYKFDLDVVHQDSEGKYTFRSCEISIYEQPSANLIKFAETPVCRVDQVRDAAPGSWESVSSVTDEVLQAARLSAKVLNSQAGTQEHIVTVVKNIKKQVVNGINYDFTVDFVVNNNNNKYTFKTCKMVVNHQSWLNKVTFLAEPECVEKDYLRAGQWIEGTVGEVQELSRWATKSLPQYTGIQGEHTIMTARQVTKQVVSGVNYKFILDVLVKNEDGKYVSKSCKLFIYEQAWTNTRKFVEAPVCQANPNFQ